MPRSKLAQLPFSLPASACQMIAISCLAAAAGSGSQWAEALALLAPEIQPPT